MYEDRVKIIPSAIHLPFFATPAAAELDRELLQTLTDADPDDPPEVL